MRTETIGLGVYALALGALVLVGLEVKKIQERDWVGLPERSQFKSLRAELQKKGDRRQPTERVWLYTKPAYDHWWLQIQDANWTGKLPPVPVAKGTETEPVKPPPKVLQPLSEIFAINMIYAGAGEDRVLIHYLDPKVEPPKPDNADPASLATAQAAADAGGKGTGVRQLLQPGDALYTPFQVVKFERFSADGLAAIFSRDAVDGGGKRVEEELRVAELTMSGDSFAGVDKIENGKGTDSKTTRKGEKPWQDPGKFSKFDSGKGIVYISRTDSRMLKKDYNRILSEDIVGSDWKPSPNLRKRYKGGVQVRHVSPAMRRFGIKTGEILVKVNGTPVSSRANAIKVGRKQFDKGTRTFTLTFISQGREVQRLWRAPD